MIQTDLDILRSCLPRASVVARGWTAWGGAWVWRLRSP